MSFIQTFPRKRSTISMWKCLQKLSCGHELLCGHGNLFYSKSPDGLCNNVSLILYINFLKKNIYLLNKILFKNFYIFLFNTFFFGFLIKAKGVCKVPNFCSSVFPWLPRTNKWFKLFFSQLQSHQIATRTVFKTTIGETTFNSWDFVAWG